MAILTIKEQIEALRVQAAEVHRLKDENEMLQNNVLTLYENFRCAKEELAKSKSEVTALKEQLSTVKVHFRENRRLKKENKTLKKKLGSSVRVITRAIADLEKPATTQATKCLKRKKNLKSEKSSGMPKNKRVKDDIDLFENLPDLSSDDSDSDSGASALALLDYYGQDYVGLYQAIQLRESAEGVRINQEPAE